MNKYIKFGVVVGLIVLAYFVGMAVGNKSSQSLNLGAGTRMTNGISTNSTSPSAGQVLTTTLTVGSTGSSVSKMLTGTANCTGAETITALASSTYECAVTGVVTSGDKVFISLPATAPASIFWNGVAYASSTASGYIRFGLANLATTTSNVAGATTSIAYFVIR